MYCYINKELSSHLPNGLNPLYYNFLPVEINNNILLFWCHGLYKLGVASHLSIENSIDEFVPSSVDILDSYYEILSSDWWFILESLNRAVNTLNGNAFTWENKHYLYKDPVNKD